MAKIPFDIKFKPQIESGEYKVETRNGRPVRIVCYDRKCGFPIMALATQSDGRESYVNCNCDGRTSTIYEYPSDLFIITPEEELTEFEIALENFVMNADASEQTFHEDVKQHATKLLAIARKELCDQIVDHTNEAYENGKAEALKDLPRWSPNDVYPELNDVVIGSIGTDEHFFIHRGRIIHLESLEKLPGFND